MLSLTLFPISFLFFLSTVAAYKPCPLLGPVFEAPTNLDDCSIFQNTLHDLKEALDNATQSGTLQYGTWSPKTNSFSLGIFDTTSPDQLFSYQYSSPALQQSKKGVKEVTEDSIYRLGSLCKLITVYLFLIEVGPSYWNQAITEYIPELEAAASNCSALEDPIDCIDWHAVTLGALASQMAGVPRDYSTLAELLDPLSLGPELAVKYGLPPLPKSATPPCGLGPTDPCPKNPFLHGLTAEHPVFAPFTTPIYSDGGAFELLEFALENITGKSFPKMLENSVFERLNMTRSSYYNPKSLQDAVYMDASSDFEAILGNETPVGGYFSTQADLARLGQSLLASTLLPPTTTRQWMKPVTFTSNALSAVGMPWEIFRVPDMTDHVFDLYTKAGDVFSYSSYLVLSPDYNTGFIVLVAGDDTTNVAALVADTVTAAIFPALEEAARQQAHEKYAGTYRSAEKDLDTEIVLLTQSGLPGLKVDRWISNGTDTLDILEGTTKLDIRLYPTNLEQDLSAAKERIAYRSITEVLGNEPKGGVFTSRCDTWTSVDSPVYGNVALDEYVFEVDGGKAVTLTPRALRTTLKKIA